MAKYNPHDPETLKVPAFQRKVSITNHARQKLLWTALDRKEAGVKPNSTRATAAPLRGLQRPEPIPTPAPIQTPIYEPPFQSTQPTQPMHRVQSGQALQPPRSPLSSPKKLKPAGEITHYLEKINVAIIKLSKPLQNGDLLLIEGPNYLFIQPVKEMQIDRNPVEKARKGDHIGMKIGFEARVGGHVYLT